jgi:FkbM family methyltransferase
MEGLPVIANRIAESLRWRGALLWRYLYLLGSFRNGGQLARNYLRRLPCERAVLWDGTEFNHPAQRLGLAQTILEIWLDKVYTGGFYKPAAGDVVIDAGANVGLFCIWLARKCPACRIYAFEPFPESFDFLTNNIRSARTLNVKPYRIALGPSKGCGVMHDGGCRSLDNQLEYRPSDAGSSDGDSVPVVGLREVFQIAETERIAFLKCDIEGSEQDLLQKVDVELLCRIEKWAIEYHDHIRPGTLQLLRDRLAHTHEVHVRPEPGQAYGMLYATRREAQQRCT